MNAITTLAELLLEEDQLDTLAGAPATGLDLAVELRDHLRGPSWIDLAESLGLCPVHGHDAEICADDELLCPAGRPDEYPAVLYLAAVIENFDRVQPPRRCPECSLIPDESGTEDIHTTHAGRVIIGCEGYYVVDPNEVGIRSDGWSDYRLDAYDLND